MVDIDTNNKYGTLEITLEDISASISNKIYTYRLKTDDYVKFTKNPMVESSFQFLLICENPYSSDGKCEKLLSDTSLLQYYTLILQ